MKLLNFILLLTLFHFINSQIPEPEPSPLPTPSTPTPPDAEIGWITFALNIVVIIVGILWVFFGYRLFKIVLFLAGFIVFYFVTFELLNNLAADKIPIWVMFVSAAVVGLIGGFLFILVNLVGFFLFGMLLGMLSTTMVFAGTPLGTLPGLLPWHQLLIITGIGIILGFLAVWLSRPLIIIGTAFNGSFLIFTVVDSMWVDSGVSRLLVTFFSDIKNPVSTDNIHNWQAYLILGGMVLFAAIGIAVQWLITAGKKNGKDKNESEMNPLLTADF